MVLTQVSTGVTAHNSYIGAFAYSGLLGVVTLVAVLVYAWVLARRLIHRGRDPLSRALGSHLLMITVAVMIAGIASECMQSVRWMQLFFAAMVFVHRRLEQISMPIGFVVPQPVQPPVGGHAPHPDGVYNSSRR
jgi:O-antigen ligase